MNERQKEVLQASISDEQAVLDALQRNYTAALADVKRSIKVLQANPLTQSKAYQLEYQQALERQITGALDVLQSKNFSTIAEYMQAAYQTAYVGNVYDLHGQGVPVMLPIDKKAVLRSVQKTGDDFKLSRKLGGNTDLLKKQVQDEIVRGLAAGSPYAKIARTISDYGEADYKRSARIARTEGHRAQNEARMDCMKNAKAKGADVVKQWDATLDGLTRESHAKMDGEIRGMEEPFSNGLMFPGDPSGKAAEVVNCRCVVLNRARWALDQDELKTLQDRAAYYGLDKTENFDDFRAKYLKAVEDSDTMNAGGASGAKKTEGWEERHADRMYEEIRHRTTDVKKIAENTQFSEKAVSSIKDHLFSEEHLFADGTMRRFDPDFEQAQAWDRLSQGKGTETDVLLLKHEFVELTQMRIHGYDYETAHAIANQKFNWWKVLCKER